MSQSQEKSGWILKAGMWACGVLAVLCVVLGGVEWNAGSHAMKDFNDLRNLGDFGSFLQGSVASLWSLAGVFLIVLAFFGQQQQLSLQRKQFNTQLESIKVQSFEASFFSTPKPAK